MSGKEKKFQLLLAELSTVPNWNLLLGQEAIRLARANACKANDFGKRNNLTLDDQEMFAVELEKRIKARMSADLSGMKSASKRKGGKKTSPTQALKLFQQNEQKVNYSLTHTQTHAHMSHQFICASIYLSIYLRI